MLFCVTGTGRCGTNLLRNLLNVHPKLYVYDETHWIPKMYEFFGTGDADVETLIAIIRRTYHVTGKPVTELDESRLRYELQGRTTMTVAQFCNALGDSFARQHGKELWADKTPDYGPYLQVLQILWPECRIVHLMRHGLEVALSMSRHPGFRWMASADEMWWVPASFNGYYRIVQTADRPFGDYIELWCRRLLRIQDEAKRLHHGSYLEVKFEDLVDRPEDILRQIAGFVGVPAPEGWLREAVAMIDTDRIHCHAGEIPRDHLSLRQRDVLEALGYAP